MEKSKDIAPDRPRSRENHVSANLLVGPSQRTSEYPSMQQHTLATRMGRRRGWRVVFQASQVSEQKMNPHVEARFVALFCMCLCYVVNVANDAIVYSANSRHIDPALCCERDRSEGP